MNPRAIAAATCAAAGVMAATLVTFWPASLGAAGKAAPAQLPKAVPEPVLGVSGCELRPRPVIGKDGTAQLELTALNMTEKWVHLKLTAALMSQPPASPMSRMMPVPRQVWNETLRVSLAPRETRVIRLKTDKKVGAGQGVFFRLKSGTSMIRSRPLMAAPAGGETPALRVRRAASAQAPRPGR